MNRLARHFDTLLQLKAIIDAGSINKAAMIIGASQPALTRNISQLEATLGVRLLDRTSKGVFPTSFGEALVAHIGAASRELDRALSALNVMRGATQGHLSCGGVPLVMDFLVPAAVKDLQRNRPLLQLRIVEEYTATLLRMLRAGEIDVVVTPQLRHGDDEDLETTELTSEQIGLFVRAAHPALTAPRSLPELAEHQHWIVPDSAGRLYPTVQAVFEDCGAPWPQHYIETSSPNAVRWLLAQTDSVAISSTRVVAQQLTSGAVAMLSGEWVLPTGRIVVQHRRSSAPLPLIEAFKAALQRAAMQWSTVFDVND